MNMPEFTASASLYKTNRSYQVAALFASNMGGQVFPTFLKGTHCVPDPDCASGFSKWFCPTSNVDDCVETGICCTPTGGGGGGGNGQPTNCGDHFCPPGDQCCGPGCCSATSHCCGNSGNCCPAGTHCCSDGDGCCPDGWSCRSIFGWHFCSPI